jgi:hypothetical protein
MNPLCSLIALICFALFPAIAQPKEAIDSSGLLINVEIDPRDTTDPFDLIIEAQIGSEEIFEAWASTRLEFLASTTLAPAIGGEKRCSQQPKPSFNASENITRFKKLRLRSNNEYGADFDWRLFEGDYAALITLHTKTDCVESDQDVSFRVPVRISRRYPES